MITVSVIVPVYNKRDYLQQSIDHILAQDLPDKEVILVDDASTDGSGELCEKLYGGRTDVRIFHQIRNGGAGRARNIGIHVARGQYVAFVDADDIIQPGYLQRLYETAIQQNADVVAESGPFVKEPTPFPETFAERCHLIWTFRYYTSACYKVYRTSFLREHYIEFHPFTFLEDVMFGIETFLCAGGGTQLPGVRYAVVKTPESITRGNLLAKCAAYMDSILRACSELDAMLARLPQAQGQTEARESLFLCLMRLSVENHFREAAKQHSLAEIHTVIAPVLKKELGPHALYVQTLLDWCMCVK